MTILTVLPLPKGEQPWSAALEPSRTYLPRYDSRTSSQQQLRQPTELHHGDNNIRRFTIIIDLFDEDAVSLSYKYEYTIEFDAIKESFRHDWMIDRR